MRSYELRPQVSGLPCSFNNYAWQSIDGFQFRKFALRLSYVEQPD